MQKLNELTDGISAAAGREIIMREVSGLALIYQKGRRSDAERMEWLKGYAETLAQQASKIEQACAAWRANAIVKDMPTPGQLLALCRNLGERPHADTATAWKPLDADDYDALPIRDKIRYHRVAGGMALQDGFGPIVARLTKVHGKDRARNINVLKADPDYQRLVERVSNHNAEAKRLIEAMAGFREREAA